MELFTQNNVVGIFRGFSEGGLEFHADLVLPYRNEFQRAPMHGQFLIVQLEDENEAVLGRITSISSEGRLTSAAGEEYGIRAVTENRPIPEDLREQYLKYRVNMRVLGVLRKNENNLVFVASHRRLPHVGSKVAFLTDEVLKEVAGHNIEDGAELGHLAFGEFIYATGDKRLKTEPWMQIKTPLVIPKFRVKDLVSRRTFIFARAGFGKSNLVKLLFANLYKDNPTVEKRGGKQVPVGTIIFDPDGEYFWPDDKNRPGLCDVPHLQDKIIVFTPKAGPSLYYQSFVAGDIKLDIRRFRPADVISIALPPEKQDQQNVRKLKGMNDNDWRELVDLIYKDGNAADGKRIKELLRLEDGQDAEMVAARANMTTIVKMLHDPRSNMIDMLLIALEYGKICIIDISQMRGSPALVLSGLILRKIFDHNQEEFTKAQPKTIPVIAVVEEAQTVLGSKGSSGEGPYIEWVKEGRKYDLGAVLITQQPGSISHEILSQGDNWFSFHLLSAGDLQAIKKANAHYSNDILSSLLNEPIPGHCVFWSSVSGKSYPLFIRVLSFEGLYQALDPRYNKGPVETAATKLKKYFTEKRAELSGSKKEAKDNLAIYIQRVIDSIKKDENYLNQLMSSGKPWRDVQERIKRELPEYLSDRDKLAYSLVTTVMTEIFGPEKSAWKTEKKQSKSNPDKNVTWIIVDK